MQLGAAKRPALAAQGFPTFVLKYRTLRLSLTPEQLKAHIDELAASYEKPEDVVRWYFGDRQRLAEVEAVVIENNVTDFVLGQAKVTDKKVSFDELMGQA